MSMLVNLQPKPPTRVECITDDHGLPTLVIHDGSATVWLSPADGLRDLAVAAGFARMLAQAAREWDRACHHAIEAARSADPLGVDHLIHDNQRRDVQRRPHRGEHP